MLYSFLLKQCFIHKVSLSLVNPTEESRVRTNRGGGGLTRNREVILPASPPPPRWQVAAPWGRRRRRRHSAGRAPPPLLPLHVAKRSSGTRSEGRRKENSFHLPLVSWFKDWSDSTVTRNWFKFSPTFFFSSWTPGWRLIIWTITKDRLTGINRPEILWIVSTRLGNGKNKGGLRGSRFKVALSSV